MVISESNGERVSFTIPPQKYRTLKKILLIIAPANFRKLILKTHELVIIISIGVEKITSGKESLTTF